MGLQPPDPHSLCPLSSTEFIEIPPPNKIPWYATGYTPDSPIHLNVVDRENIAFFLFSGAGVSGWA